MNDHGYESLQMGYNGWDNFLLKLPNEGITKKERGTMKIETEKYYIINNSYGDTSVEVVTKEELLERLNPEKPYYGKTECLAEIPKDSDTNYWGGKLLIIKGSIVVPEPITTVTKYNIK